MTDLINKKCVPCEGGIPFFTFLPFEGQGLTPRERKRLASILFAHVLVALYPWNGFPLLPRISDSVYPRNV